MDHGSPEQPTSLLATWVTLGLAVLLVGLLLSTRCALGPNTARGYESRTLPPEPEPVVLAPPKSDSEYFPCKGCHRKSKRESNPTRRELVDDHDELELAHGNLWCLDCHDTARQANLHRSDGTLIRFKHSRRLCTQCHGEKLADWKAGVHGKRTGNWWGAKEVWDCVACHNPHRPRFQALEPKPPPQRPETIAARFAERESRESQ